eukprot:gene8795-743_t
MTKRTDVPELKRYLDKKLLVKMNAGREVSGYLRGYDQFLNITLDDTVEVVKNKPDGEKLGFIVVRGNSIEMLECLEVMK